jgi:predicted RNA-binding protein with PIN domain
MPYIIDGHNLIPKIPGLSLSVIDDEDRLIKLLQEFCRLNQKKVEVYFDKAAVGEEKVRNYGNVRALFVRQGITADDAIRARLRKLGKRAHNWTVVTSDRAVQNSARYQGAKVVSSQDFAARLVDLHRGTSMDSMDKPEKPPDPEDIDYWLRQFQSPDEKL